MYVRRSNMEDIPAMMELYAQARVFMREHGNPNQWDENYPSRELLEKDIAFGNSYIVEDDEKNLAATFAFIKGEDPTYYGIENGAWLNHEPYGTIHRLAGNPSCHGIPGREDDDDDETKVVLANDDFTTVAKIVLEGVGGKDNVESVDNCITRLRLVIKDYTKVDEKKIKSAGVAGVVRPSQKDVQVIIGTKVQFVADEFKKLCK